MKPHGGHWRAALTPDKVFPLQYDGGFVHPFMGETIPGTGVIHSNKVCVPLIGVE